MTRCVPGKYSSRMKIAGRLGTPISKDIGYKIIFKSQIPLIFVELLLNSDHHYALMLFYLMSEDQNLLQKKIAYEKSQIFTGKEKNLKDNSSFFSEIGNTYWTLMMPNTYHAT